MELLAGIGFGLFKGLSLLVSYIHNNDFPQPLPEEEEAKLLQIVVKSIPDSKKMSSEQFTLIENARNKLVEHNLRLVAHLVKKFENSGVDTEDLISIGIIGLIKGINTFKLDKGTKLATYASRCIENEILMYLRKISREKSNVSIYDPIGVDKEGNEISLIDVLSEGEGISDKVELEFEHNDLIKKMQKLSERERKVLMLRYGLMGTDRVTQNEIAKSLGISRSYVSRIEKRALKKLLDDMDK